MPAWFSGWIFCVSSVSLSLGHRVAPGTGFKLCEVSNVLMNVAYSNINCSVNLLEGCQTKAIFWTFIIFQWQTLLWTWYPSSHYTHTHKTPSDSWCCCIDLVKVQRKTAFGKLSWEMILSSEESQSFWWISIVIQYTEAIYVNDTILSHI